MTWFSQGQHLVHLKQLLNCKLDILNETFSFVEHIENWKCVTYFTNKTIIINTTVFVIARIQCLKKLDPQTDYGVDDVFLNFVPDVNQMLLKVNYVTWMRLVDAHHTAGKILKSAGLQCVFPVYNSLTIWNHAMHKLLEYKVQIWLKAYFHSTL